MEINFKNKRVLVTGAAGGIGAGLTECLINYEATVIALDVSQEELDKLKKYFPPIETVCVDLTDWKKTKECVQEKLPIDLLVNNAGVAITAPFLEVTEAEIDLSFNINTKAVFNVTQTVIQDLVSRNAPGAIVNISSQASKAALQDHTVYSATKGALDSLTRTLALEFGPNKIRVNCVNPTVVMTKLGWKIWSHPEKGGPMLAKIPLNRFNEVSDVVDAVLFLLSDKAAMITGTCLPVDGGFLAC